MMPLRERVTRLFRRAQPERPTSAAGLEDAALADFEGSGAESGDRLRMYEDAEQLDAECPEAAAALDTLASLISSPPAGEELPFRVEWEAGTPANARECIETLGRRARLGPKCFALARDTAKYGDNFLEVVLDDALEVARLKHLPARRIFREEGPHGELLDPAFTQRRYPGGPPLVSFRPWQILHLRWEHLGEQRYGRSHLATARVVWRKLRPLEESMRIARLERGYDKLVHYIEIPPDAGLEEAQQRLEEYRRRSEARLVYNTGAGAYELRRQTPTVRTDFYVPVTHLDNGGRGGGDIKLLSPDNAQLAHIDDIEYLHRQLLCALRVPAAFLGFERDVNARATLTVQDAEFARRVRRAQAVLSAAFRQVFDLQLLLKGYESARYRIVWPEVRVEDELAHAEAALLRSQAKEQ